MEEEIPIASYQNISDQQIKYQLVSTAEQRSQLLTDLMQQTSVCFDTETTGLNPLTADLIGLAFCFKENKHFMCTSQRGRAKYCRSVQSFF